MQFYDLTVGFDDDGFYIAPHNETGAEWTLAQMAKYGERKATLAELNRLVARAKWHGLCVNDRLSIHHWQAPAN